MLRKEVALKLMKHLVDHWYHGYSQVSRWGDGEGVCKVEIEGQVFEVEQGDRDCSAGVISAFEAAGISCGGATYTGNMRRCMVESGNFRWHPMSEGYVAGPSDVYLKEGSHTAMCLSAVPDMLMEFSISEKGTIDGKEGDQTGWESHSRTYYDYPWDGILECINKEVIPGTEKPQNEKPQNDKPAAVVKPELSEVIHFRYRVETEEDGWLDEVENLSDYAGIQGHKIINIAIGVDVGSLWYQVHTVKGKWLPPVTGYNINDFKNGYAGDGTPIDAVCVYYMTPDEYVKKFGTYQKAQYRVSPVGKAYFDWQFDNETADKQDGYAGAFGQAIDRFQLW